MRADALTDECKYVEIVEGETTCKELFVIYNVNKNINTSCNKERDQMRKHSASDEAWYKFW